MYDIVTNTYTYPEVFYRIVKIDRYVDQEDMQNMVELIFELFRDPHGGDENEEPTMDLVQDYPLLWDIFKRHADIDLKHDDISWWEFNSILKGLILEGECSLSKVMEYRGYTKPPKNYDENKHHQDMMKLKRRFALNKTEEQSRKELNNVVKSMMQFYQYRAKKNENRGQ